MGVETFLKIKQILDDAKVEYTHLTHEHVHHSSDAAKIRGTNLEDAAKAIVLKAEFKDDNGYKSFKFIQAVIPASIRIDLKKLKIILDSKNISLASPEEVLEQTGCTIGSVPPFGKIFGIEMYMDESILEKDLIVFSAGTHTDSIQLKAEDYYRVLEPIVLEFKKL
jgi:Ala-tRNA(Pro) deacylase